MGGTFGLWFGLCPLSFFELFIKLYNIFKIRIIIIIKAGIHLIIIIFPIILQWLLFTFNIFKQIMLKIISIIIFTKVMLIQMLAKFYYIITQK